MAEWRLAENERTVRSLASFDEAVDDFSRKLMADASRPSSRPWFRGLGRANWRLIPTIYRYREAEEDELRNEFKRLARGLMVEERPDHGDGWGWYFLMRHHGLPTRLLDWCEGSHMGLYFALRSNRELVNRPDAAVWVLDPWSLNQNATGKNEVLDPSDDAADRYLPETFVRQVLPDLPVAIQPHHVSRRLAVQRGYFTIHGSSREGLEAIAVRWQAGVLAKIVIAGDAVEALRKELAVAGVRETTVFPDLDGLARELTDDFTRDPID